MTVVLVLATFLVFILLDWALNRRKVQLPLAAIVPNAASATSGKYVEGFHVPEDRWYHPGHSWVARERQNVARIGADEFASAIAGNVEKIELPRAGQWIRQGQRAFAIWRNGEKTEMVSPTEGEVIEVNTELLNNPTLLRDDPYGKGWFAVVNVPDEENTKRNLVPVNLVKSWMRDAALRLYNLQPQTAGAAAADGGRPAGDVLAGLPGVDWKKVSGEFFLTN